MCDGNCEIVNGYECMYGDGDFCQADHCKEICGDGIDHGDYGCDDGNSDTDDGCDTHCNIEPGFTCVAGDASNPSVCTETCGDSSNMGGLECDDKNGISGDGCNGNCEIELGFTCGTGNYAKFDLCYEVCGDGRVVWKWLCDDETLCNGDDRVNAKLTCDDGNEYSGDGCSADCVTEDGYKCEGGDDYTPDTCVEICGDGRMMGGLFNFNECDDLNTEDGDGCSSTCEVESGWTCANGDTTSRSICVEDCGDGLNYGEYFCDDGNNDVGDGCDANCDIEDGYECFGGSPTSPDFCWRPEPRITSVTLSRNNTVLTLNFNETTFMKDTFSTDDFSIFIVGPRDYYSFKWYIINEDVYFDNQQSFQTLQV